MIHDRLPYGLEAYPERAARAKEWLNQPGTPHFVWKVAADDVPALVHEIECLRRIVEMYEAMERATTKVLGEIGRNWDPRR